MVKPPWALVRCGRRGGARLEVYVMKRQRRKSQRIKKAELERLRARLEAMLAKSVQGRDATANAPLEGRQDGPADSADVAFTDVEELTCRGLHVAYGNIALDVERALEKIEEGTYGVCDECGEPVPLARLRALPWAIRCVRCQEKHEESSEAEEERLRATAAWTSYGDLSNGDDYEDGSLSFRASRVG